MRFLLIVFTVAVAVGIHASDLPFNAKFKALPKGANAQVVAETIWRGLECKDDRLVEAFISGMKACDQGLSSPISDDVFLEYGDAEFLLQARKNMDASNTFFQKLSQRGSVTEVVPNELYFETLEPGDGSVLNDLRRSVTVRYKVVPIEGTTERDIEPLVNTFQSWKPPTLILAELIPGLSYGMKGMKIGEKRRIYIHPNVAYGCSSNFEGGVSFKVDIELLRVAKDQHPILPLDALRLDPPEQIASVTDKLLHELKEKVAYLQGFDCWQHFRKRSDLYSLDDVVNSLCKLQSGCQLLPQDSFVDLFSQLQCLLHWEDSPSPAVP